VGRSERREVRSRLALILHHLLKWQYQPERQSRDGRNTISTQREDLSDVIADSPSLKAYQSEILADAYARSSSPAQSSGAAPTTNTNEEGKTSSLATAYRSSD